MCRCNWKTFDVLSICRPLFSKNLLDLAAYGTLFPDKAICSGSCLANLKIPFDPHLPSLLCPARNEFVSPGHAMILRAYCVFDLHGVIMCYQSFIAT